MLSEGLYSCNATNVAGRDSSVIFLDVKGKTVSYILLVYLTKNAFMKKKLLNMFIYQKIEINFLT